VLASLASLASRGALVCPLSRPLSAAVLSRPSLRLPWRRRAPSGLFCSAPAACFWPPVCACRPLAVGACARLAFVVVCRCPGRGSGWRAGCSALPARLALRGRFRGLVSVGCLLVALAPCLVSASRLRSCPCPLPCAVACVSLAASRRASRASVWLVLLFAWCSWGSRAFSRRFVDFVSGLWLTRSRSQPAW
jgi:hypothetical protein